MQSSSDKFMPADAELDYHVDVPPKPLTGNYVLEVRDGVAVWVLSSVFGSELSTTLEAGGSYTSCQSFVRKLRLSLSNLPAGKYRVEWYCEHNGGDTAVLRS